MTEQTFKVTRKWQFYIYYPSARYFVNYWNYIPTNTLDKFSLQFKKKNKINYYFLGEILLIRTNGFIPLCNTMLLPDPGLCDTISSVIGVFVAH